MFVDCATEMEMETPGYQIYPINKCFNVNAYDVCIYIYIYSGHSNIYSGHSNIYIYIYIYIYTGYSICMEVRIWVLVLDFHLVFEVGSQNKLSGQRFQEVLLSSPAISL
jgi:hypothetical protein